MSKRENQAPAPDPLVSAANVHKLVLENERVRVLEAKLKPGDRAAMHSHPDHVICVVQGGTFRSTLPDGSSTNNVLKAGQAIWRPAYSHSGANVGTTEILMLLVELKGKG